MFCFLELGAHVIYIFALVSETARYKQSKVEHNTRENLLRIKFVTLDFHNQINNQLLYNNYMNNLSNN